MTEPPAQQANSPEQKGIEVSHRSEQTSTGRLRVLARQHPVATFLLGAMMLTLAVQTPPMLAARGTIQGGALPSRFGMDMEEAASLLLVISLLAVTLAVTALEGGRPALMILLKRTIRWRVRPTWWFLSAAALPLGTIGLAVALGDAARLPSGSDLRAELLSAAVALLCINLWEEAAWAGFLQTRLERGRNFFFAAFLTAVPFSAVHLPLRVITGEATNLRQLAVAFLTLMIFTPIIRVLFGCVLRGARNSILLVAVAHTAFNRSNNTDGIAAEVLDGEARQLAALLATAALTALVVLARRRNVAPTTRAALDLAETRRSAKVDVAAAQGAP